MVDAIHEKGIIHRDICPDNIIVGKDRNMILVDYGSAINIKKDNSHVIEETTYRIGFSPKEQINGLVQAQGWLDDYSLAATVCWFVTQ